MNFSRAAFAWLLWAKLGRGFVEDVARAGKFEVKHTYNEQQIGWFRAGSALNQIRVDLGMK